MNKLRSNSGELVLEIGTEELPAGGIPTLLTSLKSRLIDLLVTARLPAENVEVYATPRRISIRGDGIPKRQSFREIEVTGPPKSAAYDAAGKPTPAATGFAKSQRISVRQLTIKKTAKGEYICAVKKEAAEPAPKILKSLLPEFITSIVSPKTMRWDDDGFKFARPIRWIVSVYDAGVIPFKLAGLTASNETRGHRFMANRRIKVKSWAGYQKDLRRHHVILDPSERERMIRRELARQAKAKKGAVVDDAVLMQEAIFLTEYPVVMTGRFEEKYLEMPAQILVTAMKEHQGYFPVFNRDGKLLPWFLFVSNIKTKHPEIIRKGNERVLRARLDDARFYFLQDRKHKLSDLNFQLGELVFHEKLGSVGMKVVRIGKLAEKLLNATLKDHDAAVRIRTAADLCKADLLTGMVREFPTLQGIMGREYALHEGVDPEAAEAIAEHYFPRHAEDPHEPRTLTGKFLTAADRIDSLVGFFGVDEIPTGSMDPYALRRQAMGLIQVFLDQAFALVSLREGIRTAVEIYSEKGVAFKKDPEKILEELERFLRQRMDTYLRRRFEPSKEYRADLSAAVISGPFDSPLDLYRRYLALMISSRRDSFGAVMTAFKRVGRIIPEGFAGRVEPERFVASVEKELWNAYQKALENVAASMRQQDYPEVMNQFALLRGPIDLFFDGVLVMDPDPKIRGNRLALLSVIRDMFGKFADFARVDVEASNSR